ncbi:MAG: hypothetical protein EOO05_12180 [Chitinophagaceae bacterium]|nr:MAG: hypothetical protein EOO05_12180 [Chitinophagaceae bacterium]
MMYISRLQKSGKSFVMAGFVKSLLLVLAACTGCKAQSDKFDLASYTAPSGWKKEIKNNVMLYSVTDKKDQSFCTLTMYQSLPSKGDIQTDFSSEWQDIVVKQLQAPAAQGDTVLESNGWQVKTAGSQFRFNNADAVALLTVFSGYGKMMSVLITTNSDRYLPDAYAVIDNIVLDIPADGATQASTVLQANDNTATSPPGISDGFKFNTTSFDDGWVSTIRPDWVEVTKEGVKVLIHYPNPVSDEYNSVASDQENKVWDFLISPKYTNLRNFERLSSYASYEPLHFLAGTLTDQSGHDKFVALFNYRGKEGYWMEFICPDRATFTRVFGVDKYDSYSRVWDPMIRMGNYNKFAVDPADLVGKWTTGFTGLTQYVNVYTGFAAGSTTYSSSQTYAFQTGNKYNWEIHVASGVTGAAKFQHVQSAGTMTMPDNWSILFSDMEGRPKTYAVEFRCVKGARILWINGMAYGKE